MPTVQHNTLTGADDHEPKGAAAASTERIYLSDGAGSGSWDKLPASSIDTTGSDDGDIFYSDGTGAGGWSAAPGGTFGSFSVGANTAATTISILDTYYKVTAGLTGEHLDGVTFTVDHLTLPTSGIYRVDASISFIGPNSDTIVFATSDDGTGVGIVGAASDHDSHITCTSSTNKHCIPLTYLHNFTAADDLYLIVKNVNSAANVVITDMSLTVSLLKET